MAKFGTKPVKYRVQCAFDEKHVFDKVFNIKEGSEEGPPSEVEAFCPFCEKPMTLKVQGEVGKDEVLMRTLERFGEK